MVGFNKALILTLTLTLTLILIVSPTPDPTQRLSLQGSCSAPLPVGAAQFVGQGSALRSLVDCEGSPPSATQGSAVTNGKPATDSSSSSSGPSREHSNGKIDSSPVMNGVALNGYGKQGQSSRQQGGGSPESASAAGLQNGVYKDAVSGPRHLSSGERSAGLAETSGCHHNSDGTVGSTRSTSEQMLGLHPNAAAARDPRLPGIGPLVPLWRSLTEAMAPVFHSVRSYPLSCVC